MRQTEAYHLDKDREVRILFLGLDNAGKTTTLKRLLHEPIDTISPTFGFSIRTLVRKGYVRLYVSDHQVYSKYLYDTAWCEQANIVGDVGGQRTLRPYWRNYFEKTDGVVWVVDSCDLSRMEDCRTELWKLLHEDVRDWHSVSDRHKRLAGASLLVFANKQDVQGAQTTDAIRKVRLFVPNVILTLYQSLRLDDIQSHSWRIQASSAVQGLNVDAGMDWLLDDISSRLYYYKEPVPSIADKHRAS